MFNKDFNPFDQDAINERRNPLSKEQVKLAKTIVKKYHNEERLPDQVYGLCYLDRNDVERIFYVGIAIDTNKRWDDHRRAILLGADPKPAYEQARFIGIDKVYMKVLDPAGEFTEAEWMAMLEEQGHVLTNAVGGNDVKRKHKTSYKHRAALLGLPPQGKLGMCDALIKIHEDIQRAANRIQRPK